MDIEHLKAELNENNPESIKAIETFVKEGNIDALDLFSSILIEEKNTKIVILQSLIQVANILKNFVHGGTERDDEILDRTINGLFYQVRSNEEVIQNAAAKAISVFAYKTNVILAFKKLMEAFNGEAKLNEKIGFINAFNEMKRFCEIEPNEEIAEDAFSILFFITQTLKSVVEHKLTDQQQKVLLETLQGFLGLCHEKIGNAEVINDIGMCLFITLQATDCESTGYCIFNCLTELCKIVFVNLGVFYQYIKPSIDLCLSAPLRSVPCIEFLIKIIEFQREMNLTESFDFVKVLFEQNFGQLFGILESLTDFSELPKDDAAPVPAVCRLFKAAELISPDVIFENDVKYFREHIGVEESNLKFAALSFLTAILDSRVDGIHEFMAEAAEAIIGVTENDQDPAVMFQAILVLSSIIMNFKEVCFNMEFSMKVLNIPNVLADQSEECIKASVPVLNAFSQILDNQNESCFELYAKVEEIIVKLCSKKEIPHSQELRKCVYDALVNYINVTPHIDFLRQTFDEHYGRIAPIVPQLNQAADEFLDQIEFVKDTIFVLGAIVERWTNTSGFSKLNELIENLLKLDSFLLKQNFTNIDEEALDLLTIITCCIRQSTKGHKEIIMTNIIEKMHQYENISTYVKAAKAAKELVNKIGNSLGDYFQPMTESIFNGFDLNPPFSVVAPSFSLLSAMFMKIPNRMNPYFEPACNFVFSFAQKDLVVLKKEMKESGSLDEFNEDVNQYFASIFDLLHALSDFAVYNGNQKELVDAIVQKVHQATKTGVFTKAKLLDYYSNDFFNSLYDFITTYMKLNDPRFSRFIRNAKFKFLIDEALKSENSLILEKFYEINRID